MTATLTSLFALTDAELSATLEGMSGAALVALYNEAAGASIKKFENKAVAVARTGAAVTTRRLATEVELETMRRAEETFAKEEAERQEAAKKLLKVGVEGKAPEAAAAPSPAPQATAASARNQLTVKLRTALKSGPKNIKQLADILGCSERQVRGAIDASRRSGLDIKNVGKGTFGL